MDRELLLFVLVAMLCTPAVYLAAALPWPTPCSAAPRDIEAVAWRAIWLPFLPAALILAALGGWAVAEPAEAETVGPLSVGAAVAVGLLATRALVRAAKAACARPRGVVAGTFGLVRPRPVIDSRLREALDEPAMRAVELHEIAHARHFDPLRVLLAQLATDLLWLLPAPRRRLATWLDALEIARDDEAIAMGARPTDLANAILTCAAWNTEARSAGGVGITGAALAARVRRLLDHTGDAPLPLEPARAWPVVAISLVSAAIAGATFGETSIAWLTRHLA